MKKPAFTFVALLLSIAAFAQSNSGEVGHSLQRGLLPYLGVSFLGGLAALLTPCVFPIIPVTVSFFVKRTEKPLKSALIYAGGIVSTFAIIGVGVSATFGSTGLSRFATNPWVNLALAAIFIALAMNLFGLYELQFGFANKFSNASRSHAGSWLAPFLAGIAFTITSFTCAGPIIAGLLAASAQGSIVYPLLGMTAYGVAFSLPFLVLALFPSLLAKLPKSGDWLGSVKPVLGFIELAAAVKFVSNADLVKQWHLLPRSTFLVLWGLIAVATALYLFGFPKKFAATGYPRRAIGIVALGIGIFFFANLHRQDFGNLDAFLPPTPYPSEGQSLVTAKSSQPPDQPVIASTYTQALADAAKLDRPVMVDFTGVTCTNCRWMEKNVFPLKPIKDRMAKMVYVQLYTDRDTASDQKNQALQQKIGGSIALPLYVLVSPQGKVIKTFEGKSDSSDEFAHFLDAALSGTQGMALNSDAGAVASR